MNKKTYDVGTTFYLRKPTKTQIKKYSLKVTTAEKLSGINVSKKLQRRLKEIDINGTRIPNDWFNSTVVYTNAGIRYPENNKSIDGLDSTTVTIIDKARVKRKSTINHIVGVTIRVPTILLRKKDRIIDIRSFPRHALRFIPLLLPKDPSFLISTRLDCKNTPGAIETIANCRRNHVCKTTKNEDRFVLDVGITSLLEPSLIIGGIFNFNELVCTCGRSTGFKTLMSRIVTHTKKIKKPKYKFTYSCPRCGARYAIIPEGDSVVFKGLGKYHKNTIVISSQYRAENQRPAPTRLIFDDEEEDEEEGW